MKNELITIIVPVYKVEKYLDRCVQSIVDQTYTNLEIILVDDGSPDNCPKMCDEWAKKDKRIKVIHKQNGGLSDARNAGLENATGKYIGFVDSDDYISPLMYEKLYKCIVDNQAEMAMGGFSTVNENGNIIKINEKNLPICDCNNIAKFYVNTGYVNKGDTSETDNIMGSVWRCLYKWEKIKDHRFEFGMFCEDILFNLPLVASKIKIATITDYLYFYFQREGSIIHTYSEEKIKKELIFVKRFIQLISPLIDEETIGAYKFCTYNNALNEYIKIGEKGYLERFKQDDFLQSLNNKFNYKSMQKKTKRVLKKFANWLTYKKMFWIYGVFYKLYVKIKKR